MFRFIQQDIKSEIPKLFYIFSIIIFVLFLILFLVLNVYMDSYVYKITETQKQDKMCDGINCQNGSKESKEILSALEEGIVVIKDEQITYSNEIFENILAQSKKN